MDKIARRRLKAAAYIVVGGMAVISALLAVYAPLNPLLRDFLVNASTELASVVVIFAVFTYFLVDAERDIDSGFEQLRAMLGSPFRMFDTPDPEEAEFDFSRRLGVARSLDLVGYNMTHLLASHKHQIAAAIKRGLHVRVILLDSESLAGKLMAAHLGDLQLVREPHQRSLRYIREIVDLATEGSARGKLQVKCMAWIPSCYLNIVDADDPAGQALIGINALVLTRRTPRRIHFVLDKSKQQAEFGFFVRQYQQLWDSIETVALSYPARSG